MMLSERFDQALQFASDLHRRQTRKGKPTPYLAHLLGTAAIVLEYGGGQDEAIAALLHDAIEDQGGRETGRIIRERFGDRVAGIVEGCTDSCEQPKPPWRQRKEDYLAHLRAADAGTLLVSAADKLYNVRSILADLRRQGPAVWGIFTASKAEVLWYYRALVEAFRRHPDHPRDLVDQLDRTVRELETLAG
ncbi:MAG: HD domain-containing protein [Sedimentisphaerales bacterium]|nr:HD domain-containing protein [Sedimentisphaerales bacterium]